VNTLLALVVMLVPAACLLLNRPRLAGLSYFLLFALASCDTARSGQNVGAAITLAFGLGVFALFCAFPAPRTSP
jgi:hypothetical protein